MIGNKQPIIKLDAIGTCSAYKGLEKVTMQPEVYNLVTDFCS